MTGRAVAAVLTRVLLVLISFQESGPRGNGVCLGMQLLLSE